MFSGSCRHRNVGVADCGGDLGSSMREAATAGAVPTDVPSGRAMRPAAHAYWRARTLRTQLLSLFILIELIAAAVAGVASIFYSRSATPVEIADCLERAAMLVKE